MKENTDVFRQIVELSPEIIIRYNEKGEMTYVSPSITRNTGKPQEHFLNRPIEEFAPVDSARALVKKVKHVFASGETTIHSLFCEGAQGRRYYIITLVPEKIDGKTVAVYGYYKDDTTQLEKNKQFEQSQKILEHVQKASQEAVHYVNEEGMIMQVNDAWIDMLGYTREEVIGKHLSLFLTDDYLKSFKDNFPLLKEKGKLSLQGAMKRKNGTTIVIQINVIVIKDDHGNFVMAASTIKDMSDVEQLKKDKDLLKKQLSQFQKTRLSEKEELVIKGLIENPQLTDEKLAQVLSIKRSTLTTIRNTLLEKEYVNKVIFPNYKLLGYEILLIVSGSLSQNQQIKHSNYPHVIYSVQSGAAYYAIAIAKNYSAAQHIVKQFATQMEDIVSRYYSLQNDTISHFFNYHTIFDVPIQTPQQERSDKQTTTLTKTEKSVLYAHTLNPNFNDKELAHSLGMSRQTVSSAKKKLYASKQAQLGYVPNIQKLHFSLLVIGHNKNERTPSSHATMHSCIFDIHGMHGHDSLHVLKDAHALDDQAHILPKVKDQKYVFSLRENVIIHHDFCSVLRCE